MCVKNKIQYIFKHTLLQIATNTYILLHLTPKLVFTHPQLLLCKVVLVSGFFTDSASLITNKHTSAVKLSGAQAGNNVEEKGFFVQKWTKHSHQTSFWSQALSHLRMLSPR